MKDQANIFFVVLTERGAELPAAINVSDIVYALPHRDGSNILLRGGEIVYVKEPADEVVNRINAAIGKTLTYWAQAALKAVGKL